MIWEDFTVTKLVSARKKRKGREDVIDEDVPLATPYNQILVIGSTVKQHGAQTQQRIEETGSEAANLGRTSSEGNAQKILDRGLDAQTTCTPKRYTNRRNIEIRSLETTA
jgi:hypothetical protein